MSAWHALHNFKLYKKSFVSTIFSFASFSSFIKKITPALIHWIKKHWMTVHISFIRFFLAFSPRFNRMPHTMLMEKVYQIQWNSSMHGIVYPESGSVLCSYCLLFSWMHIHEFVAFNEEKKEMKNKKRKKHWNILHNNRTGALQKWNRFSGANHLPTLTVWLAL